MVEASNSWLSISYQNRESLITPIQKEEAHSIIQTMMNTEQEQEE